MKKIEEVARAIYERMAAKDPEGRNYPWVSNGNSHKQNEAREYALVAMEAMRAHPHKELKEAKAYVVANLPATFRELKARDSTGFSASRIDSAIKSLHKKGVITFTKKGTESVWHRVDAALNEGKE